MAEKIIGKVHAFYDRLEKIGERKGIEALLIWSFFAILVFGVVTVTGTLTSGFHLVDDWEHAKYVDMMSSGSLLECLKETMGYDLTLRFRPLYYFNRVLMTAVFGINLTAMSVVKALEIVLALGFLYYCARQMHCNIVYAMLFSLTVMVGYQSAVWWKLGPQESYGIMMFAIGFYFLLKWLHEDKKRYGFLSLAVFLLMSLYKESFILLIPFVMLYIVYEQMKGQKLSVSNLYNAIKARFPYLLVIGLICLTEVFLFVFVVGIDNYTYIGLDESLTLSDYHDIWCGMFHKDLKWYARFTPLLCAVILTYWEQLKKLGWEIVLTLSIIVPQVITYSKTSFEERYILPVVFGYAFFFIIVCCNWKALSGKRRILYMAGLCLMLAAHARCVLVEANYFAYRGNGIQALMEDALRYSKENEDVNILSCFGPNREGNNTIHYWMRDNGVDDVYYWVENFWLDDSTSISGWNEAVDMTIDDIDIVLMYNREDRHWCYEPSLDLSDFTEHKYNTVTMYIRNK